MTPSMSTTFSSGLVGLSTQISRVSSPHRPLERGEIGLVDEVERQSPPAEHLVDEPEGAAVQVGGHHHVRPGGAHDGDQRVLGGEAGRERHRPAAFELAERLLECRPRRVGRARVVVVLDELTGPPLGVGGGLVDRGDHRAERRVRRQPGVDGAGRERVPPLRSICHEANASSKSVRVTSPSARPSRVTSSAC